METKVLNVGCGNSIIGTDRVDIIKSPATTKVCNIEKGLPYKSNVFNKVICNYVLEHMKNPYDLVLEMKRVCKPNGTISVVTDNAGYIFFNIRWRGRDYHGNYSDKSVHGNNFNSNDKHFSLYTPEHLRNLFDSAGIEVKDYGFSMWKNIESLSLKSRIFHKILRGIAGERFSKPSVYIIGRKIK